MLDLALDVHERTLRHPGGRIGGGGEAPDARIPPASHYHAGGSLHTG
ncbi:MAG: hypothetical protein ACRDU8_04670 [Egibacteraceae bacterium]